MLGLYKFDWNCGRMGEVEGLFITSEEVVKELDGEEVYFGEILGKHSKVYGSIDKNDIKVMSKDQDLIKKLYDIFGSSISGYNPLDYIKEDEDYE